MITEIRFRAAGNVANTFDPRDQTSIAWFLASRDQTSIAWFLASRDQASIALGFLVRRK